MSRACMEELVRTQHLINIVARVPKVCRAFVVKSLSIRAPHSRAKMAARVPWRYHFTSILFDFFHIYDSPLGHHHHDRWRFFAILFRSVSEWERHSQNWRGGCRLRHTFCRRNEIVSVHLALRAKRFQRDDSEGVPCRLYTHIQSSFFGHLTCTWISD